MPFHLTTGYCWRTPIESPSGQVLDNGREPRHTGLTIGIAGSLLCDRGADDWMDAGFANSIRPFLVTPATGRKCVTFNVKWHDSFGAAWHPRIGRSMWKEPRG